jgi:hypothetical protein
VPDLTDFLKELFPDVSFTTQEDAQVAAAWILANKAEFAALLREHLGRAQAAEDHPELDELL